MDMHDEYKGTRKKPQDEEEAKKYEDFFAVLNALPEQLDEEVLKFRGVEADDILAWITQNVSNNYEHTWIVSSDRDLYQLINDNVSIFNMFGRKEVTLQSLREDYDVNPSEYMLSRIIEGDKSDNILGIEGIGPKRAQGLAREYKTLDSLLEALPIKGQSKYIQNLNMGQNQLIRNEKLINLKNIVSMQSQLESMGMNHLTNLMLCEVKIEKSSKANKLKKRLVLTGLLRSIIIENHMFILEPALMNPSF